MRVLLKCVKCKLDFAQHEIVTVELIQSSIKTAECKVMARKSMFRLLQEKHFIRHHRKLDVNRNDNTTRDSK